jgi:hypothetical protein
MALLIRIFPPLIDSGGGYLPPEILQAGRRSDRASRRPADVRLLQRMQ